MKRLVTKDTVTLVVVTLLSALFVFVGSRVCATTIFESSEESYSSAQVTEIGETQEESYSTDGGLAQTVRKTIHFTATLSSGYRAGDTLPMTQELDGMYAVQPREVRKGDHILVTSNVGDESNVLEWRFVEHNRSRSLFVLVLVFFGIIILIGRGKGLATILSLALTAAVIFAVYIPSILSGYNVYLSTIVVSLFIILMSLSLINGFNKKTACAILGNIGGVAVAGILAAVMNSLLGITGMIEQDFVMLTLISDQFVVDLRAIIWGGIVIGSLGAVMDVAMSIASAMNELSETMQNRSFARMVNSGMNIGRDAIGTMTNTLILAYIGGALATVLLLVAYNKDLLYLLNMEMIVVEILQAIVGSMGILFAVPVTVLVSAYYFDRQPKFTQLP